MVPRVNGKGVEAFSNHQQSPFVVDANFSTLFESDSWPTPMLLAYLNSVLVEAWLEEHATPMGGGALKVEAAHLRNLPTPELSADSMARLGVLGDAMMRHPGSQWSLLREQASLLTLDGIYGDSGTARHAYATLKAFLVIKRSARYLRDGNPVADIA
jgi:hypothetical protein